MRARSREAAPEAAWRLVPDDLEWPPLWRELWDPPAAVHGRGQRDCLTRPALAIVGTRRPTPRGVAVTRSLAGDLSRAGWVIVSGLARGIDAAAHEGALRAGGATVAIMASGLDRTYPPGHGALRARIEACGCVVTEYPPGTPPEQAHFPERNRLVAGMARGVLVVEAPSGSGALLTAFLALDYHREVLAVPGPVDCVQARGCHKLLKAGATLVESAADVNAALFPPSPPRPTDPPGEADAVPAAGSAARWIWDRLDLEGVSLALLEARWGGSAAAWAEGLIALEMAGLIRRLPGGRAVRTIWLP